MCGSCRGLPRLHGRRIVSTAGTDTWSSGRPSDRRRPRTRAIFSGRATRSSRSACTCRAKSCRTTRRRRIERGNILEWEQPLSERLAGRTLNIAVDLEPESILYTTLMLFGASIVAAAAALALVIWWIAVADAACEITEAA